MSRVAGAFAQVLDAETQADQDAEEYIEADEDEEEEEDINQEQEMEYEDNEVGSQHSVSLF